MSLPLNTAGTAPAEAAAWANATTTAPDTGLKHPGLVSLVNACDIHLPSGQKLALIAIARCRNTHTGRSAISFKTIGRRSGFGERQASRHVEALMGLGLVSRVGKIGQCYVYAINTQALAQVDTRHGPAVDNSGGTPDMGDTDTGHFEQPPLTPMTATPDMGVRCSGGYSGFYSEGESEASASAADQVEAAFPPLPIFEDPKTEPPKPVITEPTELIDLAGPVLDAATLGALDAARADFGMDPLTPHDRELLADSAAAVGVTPNTVAGWQLGELRAADPLVDAATLAAVNAQRAANDKREPIHLADLVQQARLAGITPQAAAQHILAKPSRSFFLARYYRPEPSATPTGPVELTEAGKRAQAQIARALAPSAVPAAAVSIVASPSARPIGATVAPRYHAPVSVGASTGTGWAQKAVARFIAAEPVSRATITSAASALGLSLTDLKAQRAATLQTEGAAA